MSVRAYKIKSIEANAEPTFNCWHDERIMELSNADDGAAFNENGGIIEFWKERLRKALRDKKASYDEDTRAILRKMIKDCGEEDYVQYYCF